MNILLNIFNNTDLDIAIDYCEKYFNLETKNNNTYLYLNTKILKKYLKDGINIKYRKYIFLFLKQNKDSINFYKILNNSKKITLDKNDYVNFKLLNSNDIINLESITNIVNSIILNENKFNIINKNIIKLSNNFYADINLNRFLYSIKNDIYKYNGIVINYYNNIKNKILSLLSIKYHLNNKYANNDRTKDKLQINTNCVLILTERYEIKVWNDIINEYLPNKNIAILNSKKNIKNILNKDILKLDFLIVNSNFVHNRYFKNYFYKFIDNNNKNNINISILNSLYDNLYNKNIDNQIINNLYFFNWNIIIFDNIEKIQKLDKKNNYINYLSSNLKYYLLNNNLTDEISNYIIKNSISLNIEENIENFYIFLKKELLITCNQKSKISYNYFNLNLSDNETNLYNNLFYNNDDLKGISLFLTNPEKYNFNIQNLNEIYKINEIYYNNLIEKETKKIINIKNFFKDKKDNEDYNNYINKFFDFNMFFEDTENNINILIKDIENKIIQYKSKIEYFKRIIHEFNIKEYLCSICLDIIDKDNFCIINCGHHFCKNCLRKYINQTKKCYECPICRSNFEITNIYVPKNNNTNIICGSKINKLKEIIDNHNKIIIVTQFKDNITLNNYINKNNIRFYNLFYKNNFLKENSKNSFILEKKKSVLFCNYDDILKLNFNNINSIIFIDYPTIYNKNIFTEIKNNYLEKDISNNTISFYYIYINNTFEQTIIDKYIK